jgi:hypothetical protein
MEDILWAIEFAPTPWGSMVKRRSITIILRKCSAACMVDAGLVGDALVSVCGTRRWDVTIMISCGTDVSRHPRFPSQVAKLCHMLVRGVHDP